MPDSKKRLEVAVGLVFDAAARHVLIGRKMHGPLEGYWEFPGGKQEPGETIEQTLHRELKEEVGIRVTILATLPTIHHDYPHIAVNLHPFACQLASGDAHAAEQQEIAWVEPRSLSHYRFLPANAPLVTQTAAGLTSLLAGNPPAIPNTPPKP